MLKDGLNTYEKHNRMKSERQKPQAGHQEMNINKRSN